MTEINQNYDRNIQYQPPVSQRRNNQVRIPDYYVVDTKEKQSLREQIKENPLTAVGYEFFLRGTEHPIPTILTWLGVGYGLDKYSKASGGEYEKSLLNKIATFGDNIQNSRIIQSKPVQFILDGFRLIGKGYNKITQHSAILRAIHKTPTMPEWSMPKSEMLPYEQKILEDFHKITSTLGLISDDGNPVTNIIGGSKEKTASLSDLVVGSKEKEALKAFFKVDKISKIRETDAVNHVLLSQLGKTEDEIRLILGLGEEQASKKVKQEILKAMNNITPEMLRYIHEDTTGRYTNTAKEALKAAGQKVRIRAGHYSILGPLSRPFERIIGCDELYNKLHSITGGAKTATGKFLAKLVQMSQRGLTFGQGKLGLLLLIAPSLVDVGINIVKADKKEKIGTAANGFVESISWVFTFPLALHIMHAAGGIKYSGMTKEQVAAFRNALKEFNLKNKNGEFLTKEAYNTAKKTVMDLLKVDGQNILVRGIRKIARVLTVDLETFAGYKSKNIIMNLFRKIPNFLKNCFGVPLRFGIWTAVMMSLSGLLLKGVAKVFGRSNNYSERHEEQKANNKAQKEFTKEDLNRRLYEMQANKINESGSEEVLSDENSLNEISNNNIFTPVENSVENKDRKDTEILQHKNKNELNAERNDNYNYIPSEENTVSTQNRKSKFDTYTYVPSSENVLKPDEENDPNTRKYIPSQQAANIQKTWDNSGLESALRKADMAEEHALKILSGNFEGI